VEDGELPLQVFPEKDRCEFMVKEGGILMRSLLLAMLVLLVIDAVLFVIFVRYFFKELSMEDDHVR
jgi:hypothetical protein